MYRMMVEGKIAEREFGHMKQQERRRKQQNIGCILDYSKTNNDTSTT